MTYSFMARAFPARAQPLNRPAIELALAAATIAVILVAAFILPRPLWSTTAAGPGATGAAAHDLGWPGLLLAVGFGLACALPYRPYARALALLACASPPAWLLLGLTVALAVTALLVFPAFGSDLFEYVAYARLWAVYGEHPLLGVPALHREDWVYPLVWFPEAPAPYGPLWASIAAVMALWAGASVTANVLAHKSLCLGAYAGCCWLIWSLCPPLRRARALAAFAWSPLVLLEGLAKVHNDLLVALAMLAALRLSGAGGLIAAALGALVKLNALAVLPAIAAGMARQASWRPLALGLVGSITLFVIGYGPLWQGPETALPVLAQSNRIVWSPGSLLLAFGLDPCLTRGL
ncbi:MAG: hypothetical protein M3336_07195, partial [Chloroflexota bacterium]|nr:hypothetical protein [Chloroflexota bacterium]